MQSAIHQGGAHGGHGGHGAGEHHGHSPYGGHGGGRHQILAKGLKASNTLGL